MKNFKFIVDFYKNEADKMLVTTTTEIFLTKAKNQAEAVKLCEKKYNKNGVDFIADIRA